MSAKPKTLDRIVLDGKMSPAWPPALRLVDPVIDRKVERALSRLARFGPHIPEMTHVWRAYEMSGSWDIRWGEARRVMVGG